MLKSWGRRRAWRSPRISQVSSFGFFSVLLVRKNKNVIFVGKKLATDDFLN
jgi:hypothetical protein